MKRRLYFLVGDWTSCVVLSILAAWAAGQLPATWPMVVEMGVGMAVGMLAAMVAMPPFLALFGAMEVMLPVMLGSMMSSMLPSMLPALREDPWTMAIWASACGIAAWWFTWMVDRLLRPEGER
ncbi:MAG: hypothetical protein H7837_06185 [Magnetococcus sp. MYC-9]